MAAAAARRSRTFIGAKRGIQAFETVRAARAVVNLDRRAGRIGYRPVEIAKGGDEEKAAESAA